MSPVGVLLIIENAKHRAWLAGKLRSLGCEVFCARDLDEAADLVRAGIPNEVILVHLGREPMSAPLLHAEMARRLPGWTVSTHDTFELGAEEDDELTRSLN
jgi:hypothetical protein